MYLKKVKAKNSTNLKLVETVWDKKDKKRTQKTILNIGRFYYGFRSEKNCRRIPI